MKILTFSDLHGSLKLIKKIAVTAKKEGVDYIICAGDLTVFGDSMQMLVDKIDEIGFPVIMLHGNHEDCNELRKACQGKTNIKFMHKQVLKVGDYVILAYGGGGFSMRDVEFERWTKDVMRSIGKDKKIILVTHAPPYATKLDIILEESVGNKSIKEFIQRVQPKLAISGHLHEHAYETEKVGETLIVNAGPGGSLLEV